VPDKPIKIVCNILAKLYIYVYMPHFPKKAKPGDIEIDKVNMGILLSTSTLPNIEQKRV
jgi:hypothetical protein